MQKSTVILKHACGCEMTCGVHVELVKGIPVTRLDVCAREALYVQSCPCDASPLLHNCHLYLTRLHIPCRHASALPMHPA